MSAWASGNLASKLAEAKKRASATKPSALKAEGAPKEEAVATPTAAHVSMNGQAAQAIYQSALPSRMSEALLFLRSIPNTFASDIHSFGIVNPNANVDDYIDVVDITYPFFGQFERYQLEIRRGCLFKKEGDQSLSLAVVPVVDKKAIYLAVSKNAFPKYKFPCSDDDEWHFLTLRTPTGDVLTKEAAQAIFQCVLPSWMSEALLLLKSIPNTFASDIYPFGIVNPNANVDDYIDVADITYPFCGQFERYQLEIRRGCHFKKEGDQSLSLAVVPVVDKKAIYLAVSKNAFPKYKFPCSDDDEWHFLTLRTPTGDVLTKEATDSLMQLIEKQPKGSAFATLYAHLRSGGDVTLAMELITTCGGHCVNKGDGPMPTREGLDVNIDVYVPRPIHLAAMFGRADIIERMMLCPDGHSKYYYSSKCDRVTDRDFTALHLAACCKNGAAAILALAAHCCGEIDATMDDGERPLHLASERGYVANMEALISIGANVNSPAFSRLFGSRYTVFPLQLSIENGHLEAVRLLLEKGAAATVPEESLQWSDSKETFLSLAAAKGHVEIFKLLLSKGASPTGREMLNACRSGHKEITDLLLPEGIHVTSTDDEGYTALAFAIVRNWTDISRALIINGGDDLSAKFKDGRTALHVAIIQKQRETAFLLIDKGAAITATEYQDGSIESPLHLAAKNGDLEMVKRMVARGALTSCNNKYDKTPPCVLAAGTEAFSFLLKETLAVHDEDDLSKQFSGARRREFPVSYFLTWEGMKAEYYDEDEDDDEDEDEDEYSGTLLHWASKTFNDAAANIALLIAEGAKLDSAAAAFGDTPLHTAARFGNLSAIEALIRHGASIRAEADNGWSPLHTAAAEAKTEAVKMLLSLGADGNAVCKAGKTPLEVHLAGRPRRLLSKEEAAEIVSLLSRIGG